MFLDRRIQISDVTIPKFRPILIPIATQFMANTDTDTPILKKDRYIGRYRYLC